jgi:hypothetical protein
VTFGPCYTVLYIHYRCKKNVYKQTLAFYVCLEFTIPLFSVHTIRGGLCQATNGLPAKPSTVAGLSGPERVDLQIRGDLSAPFGSLSYHHLHDLLLEEEKIFPF